MSSSDLWAYLPLLIILIYVTLAALALLLLYGIIRVAVARGMRDHQRWLEQTGRVAGPGAGPATSYTPDGPRRF
ncbi:MULTISPECIES: hypothetical protein [unclassified Salinibacterium]|uniref:hypothetical protein n=1 Tax=unclassified Salinibacterium TaxID=2632331 RepID=UPI0014229711|nr:MULTISPECIES: hypothetical protein [unclassified Salinibacterium]